ncbi:MAG TPA: hypothetical protein PKE47_12460, partial [Verrucomicrobiota bacterium]|nr:hypothetical protein [Verrucomicrobiota bacterium]
MKSSSRILAFGAASGLAWSLVPGVLSELLHSPGEIATVMLSGLLTGVMVSLLLVLALAKSGRGTAILLGALSLPLGVFV